MGLNNFRTEQLIWDRVNSHVTYSLETNSGDSNGRKLRVQVLDGGVVTALTGVTLSLAWKTGNERNSGLDAFKIVDAALGIFEIYYTTEMLSNVGKLKASLVLVDATGRMESDTFSITVNPTIVDDNAVQGENSFTALTEALISVTDLEKNYAPKLNEVTAQLAQKVGLGTKAEMEDLSDSVISAVTGGATVNVLSIPQDYSVTAEKTTFVEKNGLGSNAMSSSTLRTGGYYNDLGVWSADTGYYSIADYIFVEQGSTYNNNAYSIRGYDSVGNVTLAISNNSEPVTINDGITVKVRLNYKISVLYIDALFSENLLNIPKLSIKTNNLEEKSVSTDKLKDESVGFLKLDKNISKHFTRIFDSWKMGYIGSDGKTYVTANNINTEKHFYLKQGVKLKLSNSDVTMRIAKSTYNNGVYYFVSRTDPISEYEIPEDGYYRLQLQKVDLTNITDISSVSEKLYGYSLDLLAKETDVLALKTEVSALSTKSNPKETPHIIEKFMHFSCDDFISPFKDLTDNADVYTSIFDSVFFSKLKAKHDLYGMVFSGYCFYETTDTNFNLSMVTDKFKKDFVENSHWLKFGFHAYNVGSSYGTANPATVLSDYNSVISQLIRITGSYDCIDRVPRIHYYAGTLGAIQNIKKAKGGIVGLLTAEDSRVNYYHSLEQTNRLMEYDRLYDKNENLLFFSTDIRMDNEGAPYSNLNARKSNTLYQNRMNDIILFFHDISYAQLTGIDGKIGSCCDFAIENGYRFDFPMNVAIR